MAFPTIVDIATATKDSEPRILEARFGDGYAQEVVDGINANPQNWSLSFVPCSKSDYETLDDYLVSMIGQSFDWANPDGDTIKVKCKKWSASYQPPNMRVLSATFEQVFVA